jgi:hypothetical protein
MIRSGPGLISMFRALVKSLVSSPQGPVLMDVEEDLGGGHFHRECAWATGADGEERNTIIIAGSFMVISITLEGWQQVATFDGDG